MELTTAQKRIMLQQFGGEVCPVCKKWKQRRWCFCRTCYFALKTGDSKLASGLYIEAFDGTDRFFENYARAKEWLQQTGLSRLDNSSTGNLFA